ncbi:golgi uridine diphosphate-N- acetylglucosamine transporter [Coemansia sp. RSA 552]|nr:golgi uridine diphosphate-N- acetylglucosamine transporter [Coemansia sp. RSA 552]
MTVASEWAGVLGFIFGGCCSNAFALESLVRAVPKSGNLITFAQFLFITMVGLPSNMDGWWRLKPRKVPVGQWAIMVVLYFCVSILNNAALGFDISIPLHIVFRSSGLIANMACGYVFMGKRYPRMQVLSVVMVTLGVVVATQAGVADARQEGSSLVGIGLLTLGVFFAAMLGLYQERIYSKYGKHWQEGLFYSHLLALPMFALFWSDIAQQARELTRSEPVPVAGVAIPYLWLSLAVNMLSQLACASGVHRMTSMSSSLTLNVVLNLRKLSSLVISVVYFRNPITPAMALGCALVFLGTFTYARISQHMRKEAKRKHE